MRPISSDIYEMNAGESPGKVHKNREEAMDKNNQNPGNRKNELFKM